MKSKWQHKTLSEVCIIKPPKSEAKCLLNNADHVSFVPMEDLGINQKFFNARHERSLDQVAGSYTYFAEGDVLLAKITPCFENGKLGIAKNLANGIGFGSSEYIVFRPTEVLNDEFLYYFLSREVFREEGAKCMSGAVGHKRVSKEFIENTTIPIPPLPEQQRIVSILDEAFAGITTAVATAKKNLKNSRDLFNSHLHNVFTSQHEGWETKILGSLCERITKGSSPKWQGVNYVEQPGILFVTSENVGEYKILLDKPKYVEEKFNIKDKKSILKRGDVLTNIVGASIGRTAIFNMDDAANINQAVCLIRCTPTILSNQFLTYMLNSTVTKKILHDNEVNSARANLSLTFFSELPIAFPSFAEQTTIVGKLDEIFSEVMDLERIYQHKLAKLAELKQSILHQAFTGQLS